jgi:hypothetical protein
VNRPKHIFLRLLLVAIPLLMAMAPATAQNTVFAGQTSDLKVVKVPGDTYVWELYKDVTGVNFATVPGNCPPGEAYFTGVSTGDSVNVMWATPGTYFFKVTAYRPGCTNNLKVGIITVLNSMPAAILGPLPPICAGDSVHLTVTLTGSAPWSITVTDGVNNFVFNNIMSSPINLTVPLIPLVSTNYWITEVTDAHSTNKTPSLPVVQEVNPKPVNSRIYQYEPVVKK